MDSPAPVRNIGTLGTLFLVGRKTQQDIQSFPIDCERITIGRDYDCNIRLYFSDVSKFHCEIIFDLLTGRACLHVHGSNGLRYIPSGSTEAIEKKPPSTITLSDGDVFVVRKKYFRFEYGPEEALDVGTPSRHTPARNRASRRSSHRLSLVPNGKTFMASPAKSRRQSAIPPVPSSLSLQVNAPQDDGSTSRAEDTVEEEAMEENELDLVDVVEGEDGDRIYLEAEESPAKVAQIAAPISSSFMTSQAKAKTPLPHTSVVPRTRIANVETPATPQAAGRMTPTHIPAQIAMTTPKGPSTLRKALLLKSARKTWHETRSPQSPVDNAIEDGSVQVRRKSRGSPGTASARSPSKSPKPYAPSESSGSEEEADEEGQVTLANESPSPSQSAVEVIAPKIRIAHESMDQGPETYVPESLEDDEDSLEQEVSHDSVSDEGDSESGELLDEVEDEGEGDDVDAVLETRTSMTPTSIRGRAHDRFYTPQIQRSAGPTRTPLSAFGGPPRPLGRLINPPRSLGRPERIIQTMKIRVPRSPIRENPTTEKLPVKLENDESIGHVPPTDRPSTPMRNAMRAEANRIRRSVATTPRRLPAPPVAGFRKMPVEVSPFRLTATPKRHHALELTSPPPANVDVPATPLDGIKNRLANLKRKSATVGRDRRATMTSFGTPARKTTLAVSATGLPESKMPIHFPVVETTSSPTPGALGPMTEGVTASPLAYRELPTTAALQDILPMRLSSASSMESIGNSTQSTASLSPPPPRASASRAKHSPQTPNLRDLKHLYPARMAVATPSFVGVRQMYQHKKSSPPAHLDGLAELYETEEAQEDTAEMIEVAAPSPLRKTFSFSQSSREVNENHIITDEEVEEQVEHSIEEEEEQVEDQAEIVVPTKRGRSASQLAETPASPPKTTRTRRAAVPEPAVEIIEPKSAPSRSRRAVKPVIKEEDAVESKSTSTRARRAPTVEVVDTHAEPTSTSSRKTRKATAKTEDNAPEKPIGSRRAVKKAGTNEPPADEPEPVSKTSRSRARKGAEPLVETPEDSQDKPEPSSAPSKRKTASKTTRVATSSSSRTSKLREDKENVPEADRGSKASVRKTAVKKTVEKTVETPVQETSAPSRRTRSRA